MAGNPGARRIGKSRKPVSGERIAKLRERAWNKFWALEYQAGELSLSAEQIMEKHQEVANIVNIIESGNVKKLPDAIHKFESDAGKLKRELDSLIVRTQKVHANAKNVGDERLVKHIESFAISLGARRTDIELAINSMNAFKRNIKERHGILID